MEAVFYIVPIFLVSAVVSVYWLAPMSDRVWVWIDGTNALIGLAAAIITLFQVNTTLYEQKLERALSETRLNLAWVLTRTEYEMENCGIWWGDVLEDYETANAKAAVECRSTVNGLPACDMCRIAHLTGQYRSLAFSPDEPEFNADNLSFNICDGQEDTYQMCSSISAYVASAENVTRIKAEKSRLSEIAGGPAAQWVLQILVALFLALQLGRTVHSRRKADL